MTGINLVPKRKGEVDRSWDSQATGKTVFCDQPVSAAAELAEPRPLPWPQLGVSEPPLPPLGFLVYGRRWGNHGKYML